mmetsp:Transcript_346/g.1408  ORF Transcript_346/g.1408 Transcript_346/m.1408 type:complete len:230 (-) Transcript_346:1545-2234(-)
MVLFLFLHIRKRRTNRAPSVLLQGPGRQVDTRLVFRAAKHLDAGALLRVVQVVPLVRAAKRDSYAAPPLEAVGRRHYLKDHPRWLPRLQKLRIGLVKRVKERNVGRDARLVVALARARRVELPVPRTEDPLRNIVRAACGGVIVLQVHDDISFRVGGHNPEVHVGRSGDLKVAVQRPGVHERMPAPREALVVQQVANEDHGVVPRVDLQGIPFLPCLDLELGSPAWRRL